MNLHFFNQNQSYSIVVKLFNLVMTFSDKLCILGIAIHRNTIIGTLINTARIMQLA